MFAISDSAHAIGYQTAAVACMLLVIVLVARVLTGGRSWQSTRLSLFALIIGAAFYQSTSAIFLVGDATIFGIKHLFALSTHVLGVVWNFATTLLVLHWRDGKVARTTTTWIAALAAAGVATLIGCFVVLYPGPAEPNFIMGISGTAGQVYISTYAMSMLLSKILLLAICVPAIRRIPRRDVRLGVLLVSCGSALIAVFALSRLISAYAIVFDVTPPQMEMIPFWSHVVGAVTYVLGFAIVEMALSARAARSLVSGWRTCLRLGPICRAAGEQFPSLRVTQPNVRLGDLFSADRMAGHVVARVVLLMDTALLVYPPPRASDGNRAAVLSPSTPLLIARTIHREDVLHACRAAADYKLARRGGDDAAAFTTALQPFARRADVVSAVSDREEGRLSASSSHGA